MCCGLIYAQNAGNIRVGFSIFIADIRGLDFSKKMDFHPSQIPIAKVFDVNDEKKATQAAEEMVKMKFEDRKDGFKVLMPKEKKLAKRIGYTVITTVNVGLRSTKQNRSIRYWTYHEDDAHYAIVLVSSNVLEKLGL